MAGAAVPDVLVLGQTITTESGCPPRSGGIRLQRRGIPDCADPCPADRDNECFTPCPLDVDGDDVGDCADPCPWGPNGPCASPPTGAAPGGGPR